MNKSYFSDLSWTPTGVFVFLHHVMMVIGLPFYFYFAPPGLGIIVAALILFVMTGLGITLGYHRLFAHCSYKIAKSLEAAVIFLGTLAIQGSVLRWSNDHRLHHRYVDRDRDPYNVKKGLLYAHVLWIFEKHPAIDPKVVPDLYKNTLLVFQNRYYVASAITSNTIVSLIIGWLTGDYIGAFVLCWGARLLVTYHATWFINSLAHYWGEKSYSKELSARDNALVALLTFGEGYHNFHHTFPSDYRNGIRIYHFDPGKWIIWVLSKFGMSWDLRRFQRDAIMDRLITLDTRLLKQRVTELSQSPQHLRMILRQRALDTQSALERHIEGLAESLRFTHAEITRLIRDYRDVRRSSRDKGRLRTLKAALKETRRVYTDKWKSWSALCTMILRGKKMPTRNIGLS